MSMHDKYDQDILSALRKIERNLSLIARALTANQEDTEYVNQKKGIINEQNNED